ncbi:hypothetical protein EAH89_19230 [Roseomonas nepalensis]|uniref:Rhamnan synthesis protein F n=1 Tax=Muricoccus nepalensis TaxID=1854500 RepID=A0A502FR51_9PROT|nr:hypothetical protein [Roseomonas nepalensis]TPG51891.1 hypothetical protein EAH89_19230 [Roseomonas nepalensis]
MKLQGRRLAADRSIGRSSSLTAVVERPDRRLGFRARLRAYAARPGFRQSILRAAFSLLRERVRAARVDLRTRLDRSAPIRSFRTGEVPLERARSLAVFIHYAPVPAVSRMVLEQVRALREEGFAVVFVSMAPSLPAADLARLGPLCGAIVERRNHGLDFGAWHDVLPLALARAPEATELLLANDSLCGPFRPLRPALSAMRAAPEGLYGLTENLAPSPHLQSYFLLATGRRAVDDVAAFLAAHRVTANKRRTIREGEVRLSGWMRGRGHAVAAWCGYERAEAAALRRAAARRRVRALYPHLFAGLGRTTRRACARRCASARSTARISSGGSSSRSSAFPSSRPTCCCATRSASPTISPGARCSAGMRRRSPWWRSTSPSSAAPCPRRRRPARRARSRPEG